MAADMAGKACFHAQQAVEKALDTYYLWTRCPDAVPGSIEDGMPGREDALEVIEMAKAVLAEVDDLLGNG